MSVFGNSHTKGGDIDSLWQICKTLGLYHAVLIQRLRVH